jgi:hypothetical protein
MRRARFVHRPRETIGVPVRLLEDWPLLRQLWVEPRFRWSAAATVLLATLLGLSIPSWGNQTLPDGLFLPRPSLLQRVESRLLRNRAVRLEAAGDPHGAAILWRSAIAYAPADPSNLRGAVSNRLLRPPASPVESAELLHHCFRLLRISGSDRADRTLVLRAFRVLEADALVLRLVQQSTAPVPAELEAGCLALLRLGDVRFRDLRRRLGPAVPGSELALIDLAAIAGWDAEEPGVEALVQLEAAGRHPVPDRAGFALSLLLKVHRIRRDPDRHRTVLGQLQSLRRDSPRQHAEGWRLTAEAGHLREAQEEARRFHHPPVTLADLLTVAEGLESLGLVEDALRCLESLGPAPDPSGAVAISRARALIRLGRWTELRQLALGLRHPNFTSNLLAGLSELLEGLAEAREGRVESAIRRLHSAMESGIADEDPDREALCGLLSLEGSRSARKLLRDLVPDPRHTDGHRRLVACLASGEGGPVESPDENRN